MISTFLFLSQLLITDGTHTCTRTLPFMWPCNTFKGWFPGVNGTSCCGELHWIHFLNVVESFIRPWFSSFSRRLLLFDRHSLFSYILIGMQETWLTDIDIDTEIDCSAMRDETDGGELQCCSQVTSILQAKKQEELFYLSHNSINGAKTRIKTSAKIK